MTRSKLNISIIITALLIIFLILTGCVTIPVGTIKDVPGGEVQIKNSQHIHNPVVEQEMVIVRPLSEPSPPPDYVVGTYDVLSINVGKPDFSGVGSAAGTSALNESNVDTVAQTNCYKVDGKGNIRLPYVGTLHVAGMTLQQIHDQLMNIYPKYFKDPWVSIDVKEYKSQPLYILGQFNNTGVFYMDRPFNVLQGLALGKGYDAAANPRAARVIRDKKVLPVDIYELLMNADQTQNIWLKPGDTIYMPDNKNRVVFVFGASKGGGPISIPPAGLNLLQAIATSGLQEIGYHARRVFLIRSFSPMRGQLMVIDVDKIIEGDALPIALTEGDIIYIPKNALTTWNEALGEMLPTLSAFSTILSPFVQIKYLRD